LARFYTLTLSLLLLLTAFSITDSDAQTPRYEVLPAPDIWYNDVDGILLGLRLTGQVPGTFEDGPHRLDAGIWIGLWWPSLPVSYRITYTEPIRPWSDYGSEANIQFNSSVRTGYHDHGIGFNKRWQQGFDERRYREFSFYNSYERRFDDEYAAFPALWSDDHKILTTLTYELQNDNRFGWYNIETIGRLQYLNDLYTAWTLRATQGINFHEYWGLRFRSFTGITSENAAPEYLFSRSVRPAVQWLESGSTRAKGTIRQPWMESGNIHVAGGANLRGYTSQDIGTFQISCLETDDAGNCLNEGASPNLFSSFTSINAEFDYWNPIAKVFNNIPYASEFLNFRSYLFFDAGMSLGVQEGEPDDLFSNAGAGFSLSLNIPDYLGKPRGFVLRYEIPFWLSDPGDEDSFKLRHLVGLGAVISF
jgi:hypothetical protein